MSRKKFYQFAGFWEFFAWFCQRSSNDTLQLMILSVDSYFIGKRSETSFDMANAPGDDDGITIHKN